MLFVICVYVCIMYHISYNIHNSGNKIPIHICNNNKLLKQRMIINRTGANVGCSKIYIFMREH